MQTAQVLQHYSLSSSSHLRSILLDRSIDAKNYELHCLERHVDLEIAPEMMNQGEGGRALDFSLCAFPLPFCLGTAMARCNAHLISGAPDLLQR
jgi:hypothetical protein